MKLTTKRVAKFLHRPGRYGDGDGLYLKVSRPGRGSWILRYERAGRERAMGLGKLADFTLAEARQRARAARQLLADGVDPLDQRQAKREQAEIAAAKNVTFLKCAEQYVAAHSAEWSVKHHEQFRNSLRDHVHPVIGALPVADIDEALVLKVLAPIWKDKTVTAKRVRNRIESVIDYAVACKYRPTGSNPARWEGQLEYLLAAPEKIATVKHLAALPHADIAALISELRGIEAVRARALEFLIITATRTSEVAEGVWSEIDLAERMWVIPAERMKAGREHRVPLSDRALEILRQLPREPDNSFVFIGTKPGTGIDVVGMYQLLKRLRAGITVHGFRSSFSDWAHESTGFDAHTIELSLAHSIGSSTEKAYRRTDLLDKRRRLMDAWSAYCATPKIEAAAVVPMRSRHA